MVGNREKSGKERFKTGKKNVYAGNRTYIPREIPMEREIEKKKTTSERGKGARTKRNERWEEPTKKILWPCGKKPFYIPHMVSVTYTRRRPFETETNRSLSYWHHSNSRHQRQRGTWLFFLVVLFLYLSCMPCRSCEQFSTRRRLVASHGDKEQKKKKQNDFDMLKSAWWIFKRTDYDHLG